MAGAPFLATTIGPGLPTLRIGDGPRPLLYLPGLTTEPGVPTGRELGWAIAGWAPLLDRYTIYRAGRRVRPVGTSFREMADDAVQALERLGGSVDLMGASTGGAIALEAAAARPELVRRLVLVTTAHRLSDEGKRKARAASDAAARGAWRTVAREMVTIGLTSRPARAAAAAVGWLFAPLILGTPADPTEVRAELEAWLAWDGGDLATSVAAPTLLIGTAHDRVFPPALVRELARDLPEATVVIAPKGAHAFPGDAIEAHVAPFLG